MAKVTGKYETLFIVNPTLGEEEISALVQKFQSLVEANGTVDKVEDWGKRRMAYAIDDLHEGYYTLIQLRPLRLSRLSSTVSTRLRTA